MAPRLRESAFNITSRDEMNLVEFPISVLSKRVDPKLKTLEFTDYITSKSGEKVERRWIITGADKFGLPTSSDDEVLLGLLKLSVDGGLSDRKVYFTRYELLRVLHWSTEGRSYIRLQRALDRLSGVRIKATNAFFDNESKRYNTRNFGLIDEYEISSHRGQDLPNSYFVWSDVLFHSFQVGFIKKLDLNFYLSLNSAIAKRLFRYLDKHFWYRGSVTKNLFDLCHEKIGVSRNYKYASSLIQQIEPGLQELIECHFLESVEFVGTGKRTQIVLRAGDRDSNRTSSSQDHIIKDSGNVVHKPVPTKYMHSHPEAADPMVSDSSLEANLSEELTKDLIARGLRMSQVRKLLQYKSETILIKMSGIVRYYDSLRASNSSLISRSPVGFLYKAVENAEAFCLPGQFLSQRREAEVNNLTVPSRKAVEPSVALVTAQTPIISFERMKQIYGEARVEAIQQEVEQALSRIKGVISEKRFVEAVKHGVAKKLQIIAT